MWNRQLSVKLFALLQAKRAQVSNKTVQSVLKVFSDTVAPSPRSMQVTVTSHRWKRKEITMTEQRIFLLILK